MCTTDKSIGSMKRCALLYFYLRGKQDQDSIQVYNDTKPLHQQRNIMCLIGEVKTLGATASPHGKTTDMVYFNNHYVKTMIMLNSRNRKISILEIKRKSIITLLNKQPYLSHSRHLESRYVAIKSLKNEYRS